MFSQEVTPLSDKVTQAIVLAGGEGTRLRPLTNTRPKPLLPVLGRPCIEYAIRSLASAGIEQIFIACGYRSADILAALDDGKGLGVELIYAFEEEPAGTAGAVKLLEDGLEGTFVVASGDVLAEVDVGQLISFHMSKGAVATIALTEVDRPQEFGIVGLDDDQRIVRFKEKPEPNEVFSNLINAGIYVLQSQVLDYIPELEKYDFSRNVFPSLLSNGEPLFGSRLAGYWKDIGRPSDLLEANLSMAAMKGGAVRAEGVTISGRICATAFSAKGATLEGPLYIGEAVVIGERTKLASSIIGKGTAIGKGVEVSGSLLMENCVLEDDCSVTGSLMGERCKVGRGVSLTDCVIGDGAVLEGPTVLEDESVG